MNWWKKAATFARQHIEDCHTYGYYMEDNEYEIKFREKLIELTVLACVDELETNKECDPYTGHLFNSPKNTVLAQAIEDLRETFGLGDA